MAISEREVYIYRRARQMAGSGRYSDYLRIEDALITMGYPEAHDVLGRDSFRQELKVACDNARKAATDA